MQTGIMMDVMQTFHEVRHIVGLRLLLAGGASSRRSQGRYNSLQMSMLADVYMLSCGLMLLASKNRGGLSHSSLVRRIYLFQILLQCVYMVSITAF
jgi:hypothetical protein